MCQHNQENDSPLESKGPDLGNFPHHLCHPREQLPSPQLEHGLGLSNHQLMFPHSRGHEPHHWLD